MTRTKKERGMDIPRIRMTNAEYIAMPNDGKSYELHDGILIEQNYPLPNGVEMASPTVIHNAIVSLLVMLLGQVVRSQGLGRVFGDNLDYILAEGVILRPDVSFVVGSRIEGPLPDYFHFAPDLAVEVLSPSNSASEISYKINAYLRHGSRLIWIIDPAMSTVTIHEPGAEGTIVSRVLSREDTLTGGVVLPEFSLPVEIIFSEIEAL
jgi:Uma2 family endonuclease